MYLLTNFFNIFFFLWLSVSYSNQGNPKLEISNGNEIFSETYRN